MNRIETFFDICLFAVAEILKRMPMPRTKGGLDNNTCIHPQTFQGIRIPFNASIQRDFFLASNLASPVVSAILDLKIITFLKPDTLTLVSS